MAKSINYRVNNYIKRGKFKKKSNTKSYRLSAQPRSNLTRAFPVCYSGKHFVNFSPGNQHFILIQK